MTQARVPGGNTTEEHTFGLLSCHNAQFGRIVIVMVIIVIVIVIIMWWLRLAFVLCVCVTRQCYLCTIHICTHICCTHLRVFFSCDAPKRIIIPPDGLVCSHTSSSYLSCLCRCVSVSLAPYLTRASYLSIRARAIRVHVLTAHTYTEHNLYRQYIHTLQAGKRVHNLLHTQILRISCAYAL